MECKQECKIIETTKDEATWVAGIQNTNILHLLNKNQMKNEKWISYSA